MRISGGFLRGRVFNPPAKNWPTRPTTDISREALFNILTNLLDFENTRMLDLFGGTGAHTYEMISRGCTNACYVDLHKPCMEFVKKTAASFQIIQFIEFVNADYLHFVKSCNKQFNYVFAGPPYPLPTLSKIPDLIVDVNIVMPDGFFVLEHNPQHDFTKHSHFWQVRNYGQTFFSFFRF